MINVSVVLGDSSVDICNRVSKLRDGFNLSPYSNLENLFLESEYAQHSLNRVVVSSTVLEYGDVNDNITRLRNLIRNQSEFASVVFLCKEEKDADLEEILLSSFTESECAVLSILSSTINSIIEFMSLDITDLRKKYGYVSKNNISDEDVLLNDEVESQEEEPTIVVEDDTLVEEEQPKKKRSNFLNSLFGKSKKTDTNEQSTDDDNNSDCDSVDDSEESSNGIDADSTSSEVGNTDSNEVNSSESVGTDGNEEDVQKSEYSSEEFSSEEQTNVSDENTGHSRHNAKLVLSEVLSKPDLVQVEDDDDSLLNFEDEGSYREKAVKVVEVEKVVEKVVHVQASKGSVFDKSNKKLVLVTGDRRSGVTTFAFNLASILSKHMRVLYVDCDVVRHGVLSMIDYSEFKRNDNVTVNAMQLCNNWNDIQRGVFRISSNFDILTSDYGIEVEDEQLENIIEAIADYYVKYDAVIMDIPLEKLHCAKAVLGLAKPVVTCEGTFNGVLGFVSEAELGAGKGVSARFMNAICKKGTLVYTKVANKFNPNTIKSQVDGILDLDYNWLEMRCIAQPTLDENSLNFILEV